MAGQDNGRNHKDTPMSLFFLFKDTRVSIYAGSVGRVASHRKQGPLMSNRLSALVLAIIAIGVAHMSEQLATSIEEFYMIREALGGWYAMFPATHADHATVTLITLVFTAISLMFYALMRGGRAPMVIAATFGLLGIGEAHHWLEAATTGAYDPGLFTSFLYVGVGLLIVREVAREFRRGRDNSASLA